MSVGVESKCHGCNRREPFGIVRGRVVHSIYYTDAATDRTYALKGEFVLCRNVDDELRHVAEPFGFFLFTWMPKRCRNGRWRFLRWVEQHGDGTYTLGNRAH